MFRDLPDLLKPGDLLVINRSRVVPARLLGRRPGGGAAEILLVRSRARGDWDALVRPGRRLKAGTRVALGDGLEATVGRAPGLPGPPPGTPASGHAPLPGRRPRSRPRTRRPHAPSSLHQAAKPSPSDRERYQTVYAREAGSVAAPTAGLHFSRRLLDRLDQRGIERAEVVLHVGPGTFQPVKAERVEDHSVASEPFLLPEEAAAAVARARAAGGGWSRSGPPPPACSRPAPRPIAPCAPAQGETASRHRPRRRFQVVDGLVTNFHLPRSSLLLLVAAFAGREHVLAGLREALAAGYRFYSYGDAMLVAPAG